MYKFFFKKVKNMYIRVFVYYLSAVVYKVIAKLRLYLLYFYYVKTELKYKKLKKKFKNRIPHYFVYKFILVNCWLEIMSKQFFLFFSMSSKPPIHFFFIDYMRYFYNFPKVKLWIISTYVWYCWFKLLLLITFVVLNVVRTTYRFVKTTTIVYFLFARYHKLVVRRRYYWFTVKEYLKHLIIFIKNKTFLFNFIYFLLFPYKVKNVYYY